MSTLLFDLDGTLIDTWNLYVESYKKSLESIYPNGLSDQELLHLRPTSEIKFFARMPEAKNPDRMLQRFYELYEALHPSVCEGMYPGIAELLEELKRSQTQLGIVTGKSRPAYQITEKFLNLRDFSVVITESELNEGKPSPEGLLNAMEILEADPRDTIYIGDSLVDFQASERAGIKFGACLWSKEIMEIDAFVEMVQSPITLYFREPGDISNFLLTSISQ